ncbi:MAG: hypothetical protein ACHQUC_01370 [Chlamydiales bacterium]
MSNKINILIAFPYLKKEEIKFLKEHEDHINILVDSGAFTAWKKGLNISVDDYATFIKKLPFKPWGYFTLDVIGDAKKSLQNYKELKKLNLKPVPIFTRGEELEVLEWYYSQSDYVSIGGLVGTKGNRGFVNGIMKHVNGRKVHWLGFTNQDYLQHYKPYSCDSSSWAGGMMYGNLKLYDSGGKFHVINRKTLMNKPSERVIWLLQNVYNCDPNRLKNPGEWVNKLGKSALRELSFKSSVRYQADVTQKTGVNYFLAIANVGDLKSTMETYKDLKGNL